MSNVGVFRKKKVYFTQVSNTALRDDSLSLKAKGLYSLIQSYITLENFTLYKNYLIKQCKEGKDAFQTAWKELIKAGYLIQYKLKNQKGVFFYEYELMDTPQNPDVENPDVENPDVENKDVYKDTKKKKTNYNNTKSSSSNNTINDDNINSSSNKEEDLRCIKIIDKCKEVGIKISTQQVHSLMNLYDPIKVMRALEKCINAAKKKIANGYNYIATIIENDMKQNITNITINNPKKNIYTDYPQRERTDEEYADLENKLLGWDKE